MASCDVKQFIQQQESLPLLDDWFDEAMRVSTDSGQNHPEAISGGGTGDPSGEVEITNNRPPAP
jgi:hypothetical protein